MNIKSKNIELCIGSYNKLPDIAVIMGTHFKVPKECLNMLKCNYPSTILYTGMESACLAYALYECIRDKLIGSPLEIARSRVSRMGCDSINGKIVYTWNTQGTGSMLRKTIGLAVSCLAPHKLYSKYTENCKLMGYKPNRQVFNKLANNMADEIKKIIKIAVVGKININKEKATDMLDKILQKLPSNYIDKDVEQTPVYEKYECEYPRIKSKGIASVAVADYILSKSGGMAVDVFDDHVVVYNKSWKSKETALSDPDRIKDYVRQKYEKLGSNFHFIFAYLAITRSLAECCTVTEILKTKSDPSGMFALIKKTLNP